MAKGPRAGAADRAVTAVGESVRTRRVILGLTATQVAERAGVTRATLRALETGTGNPTWDAVSSGAGSAASRSSTRTS